MRRQIFAAAQLELASGWLHDGLESAYAAGPLCDSIGIVAALLCRVREERMMKWMAALLFAFALAAGTVPQSAFAQAYPPNEMGVTMGHWHLNSRDIEATKKILVAMGGTAMKAGNFQVVKFPGVYVFLHLGPGAAPATGGTVGTVVNHVGF